VTKNTERILEIVSKGNWSMGTRDSLSSIAVALPTRFTFLRVVEVQTRWDSKATCPATQPYSFLFFASFFTGQMKCQCDMKLALLISSVVYCGISSGSGSKKV